MSQVSHVNDVIFFELFVSMNIESSCAFFPSFSFHKRSNVVYLFKSLKALREQSNSGESDFSKKW